jgi:two-component system, NarL family, response regulator DegU
MSETTVIVVDDHPLFRQGVVDSLSLEPDIRVVGQAATGEEALELIRSLYPQVAIVDINLPGINGLQVTHQVIAEKIPTRIVLLTGYDDSEQILHAAIAGATGYCAKDIEPRHLTTVVKHINNGEYVIGDLVFTRKEFDRWLEKQLETARRSYSEPGSPFHPLSDREMEVLECVVRGMSNKEIAALLGISHQTVKNHVTSILRKFGVDDRTQAVVYALKRGWVKLNLDKSQE